jgi:hypothetical protein
VGNFNRDGKSDIVTCSDNDTVAVLLGNGDGIFGKPIHYSVSGGGSYAVAVVHYTIVEDNS